LYHQIQVGVKKKKLTENVKRESKMYYMLSCTPMQGLLYRQIEVGKKNQITKKKIKKK